MQGGKRKNKKQKIPDDRMYRGISDGIWNKRHAEKKEPWSGVIIE